MITRRSGRPHPGCTATRELEAHHVIAVEHGGKTELDNLTLLCPRHHKHHHDQPANRPHAPPAG
jgi:5-methylcytosine-specific restriction endonuclease McrA